MPCLYPSESFVHNQIPNQVSNEGIFNNKNVINIFNQDFESINIFMSHYLQQQDSVGFMKDQSNQLNNMYITDDESSTFDPLSIDDQASFLI